MSKFPNFKPENPGLYFVTVVCRSQEEQAKMLHDLYEQNYKPSGVGNFRFSKNTIGTDVPWVTKN